MPAGVRWSVADGIQVQASLIVASFELFAVRSIREAVRVNTLQKGGREGPLGNIENPKPPPSLANYGEQRHGTVATSVAHTVGLSERSRTALDCYRAVDCACRCDDREIRYATLGQPPLQSLIPNDITLPTSDAERAEGVPSRHPSPLVPPWELPLPLVHPAPVKCVVRHVEVVTKGTHLDVFL